MAEKKEVIAINYGVKMMTLVALHIFFVCYMYMCVHIFLFHIQLVGS